ncbi:MAG: pseudouridine synthase [Gammaproteobacteria bacterium]|nr:MAG: pseudouridine synthase [Gammaproteobacteria bacterium]
MLINSPKSNLVQKKSKLILFNKPFNTLCQFSGEAMESTLADYINIKGVYPAGRLDKDSEGLLLLTDNGKLQHRISHPNHKLSKTYWVQLDGDIDDLAILKLENGVCLKDGETKPAKARRLEYPFKDFVLWERNPPVRFRKNIPTSWIELIIKEGKNRQIRRMTAAVGFPTLRLIRMAIGDWKLDDLQPAEYTKLAVE